MTSRGWSGPTAAAPPTPSPATCASVVCASRSACRLTSASAPRCWPWLPTPGSRRPAAPRRRGRRAAHPRARRLAAGDPGDLPTRGSPPRRAAVLHRRRRAPLPGVHHRPAQPRHHHPWSCGIAAAPASRTASAAARPPACATSPCRWIATIGLGGTEPIVAKTLRRRPLHLPGRLTRSARRRLLHLPTGHGPHSSSTPLPAFARYQHPAEARPDIGWSTASRPCTGAFVGSPRQLAFSSSPPTADTRPHTAPATPTPAAHRQHDPNEPNNDGSRLRACQRKAQQWARLAVRELSVRAETDKRSSDAR
jgi:hypothetical protein